ncbi:hypothetical protein ACLOJK_029075 [Asimina triloba]
MGQDNTGTYPLGEEKSCAVKLHGVWASSFCMRVELALKLKGIAYEYVQEDLSNKSQLLLKYNPVHKKVPVLVHHGHPIAESLIILEYIDDVWNDDHRPLLLPRDDPYKRSRYRFWAAFYNQKVVANSTVIFRRDGEEQAQAVKEFIENIGVFEEGIREDFSSEKPFFHGERPGYLDVAIGALACWNPVLEAVAGAKLIDRDKNPFLSDWLDAFRDLDVVKETFPPHDQLLTLAMHVRKQHLESAVTT